MSKPLVSGYQEMIMESTGCTAKQVPEVEDIMRHSVFHSTLDWQTRLEFDKGAKEAYVILRLMKKRRKVA